MIPNLDSLSNIRKKRLNIAEDYLIMVAPVQYDFDTPMTHEVYINKRQDVLYSVYSLKETSEILFILKAETDLGSINDVSVMTGPSSGFKSMIKELKLKLVKKDFGKEENV